MKTVMTFYQPVLPLFVYFKMGVFIEEMPSDF